MANWFECYDCHKAAPLMNEGDERKCPLCGGKNGSVLTPEQFKEKRDAGALYDILGKKEKR